MKRTRVPRFKGQYELYVDNKGRVSFPAKLRKLLNPEARDQFTVIRGLETCLYIYPQDEWERVEDKLKQINSFTRNGRTEIINLLRHAEDHSMDIQNWLSLPSCLLSYTT